LQILPLQRCERTGPGTSDCIEIRDRPNLVRLCRENAEHLTVCNCVSRLYPSSCFYLKKINIYFVTLEFLNMQKLALTSLTMVKWDLWWTKWRWGRFPPSTSVSPANLHSINCSTVTLIYHLGLYNRPAVAAVPGDISPAPQKKNFADNRRPLGRYSSLADYKPRSLVFRVSGTELKDVFTSTHSVSDTGFCFLLQVEPTHLGPIDRKSVV
jgi:hypothetical protein